MWTDATIKALFQNVSVEEWQLAWAGVRGSLVGAFEYGGDVSVLIDAHVENCLEALAEVRREGRGWIS